MAVLKESHDEEQIIARVAALDIGKAELVCCVRVPAPDSARKRLQEVSTHSTMTGSLIELANRLVELRVERVVMEATSDYWKPVFYLLEAHGLAPWLVNARDVKHLPGRPKTDLLTELPRRVRGGCVPGEVRLARFAARDRRWRSAAGFGGAGGAGSRWFGGDRRPVPAVSAG
ncbi:MAG TPA: transposase [Mycobacterium sp.]|nr:transposase [Mycobacterium sp.]